MADIDPCWLIPDNLAAVERDDQATLAPDTRAVAFGPSYYPPADRSTQWFGDTYPGVDMGGVDKIVWHTTETVSWPGYAGGASAPTLTYHPRRHEWRQHFRLYRSARALRDPDYTLVRENRDKVVQVELVAFSDHGMADRYSGLDVRDLDDRALRDLGAFARFMHEEYGVPYFAAPLLDYPASYGNSRVRMTGPQFDAFKGHCGHENVSGNSHGDPDLMPLGKVLANAQGDDEMTPEQMKQLKDHITAQVNAVAAKVWAHPLPYLVTADPDDKKTAGQLQSFTHKHASDAAKNTDPEPVEPPTP